MKKIKTIMEKLIQAYKEFNAYMKYKNAAKQYTTPLTFEAWKYQITNLIYGC